MGVTDAPQWLLPAYVRSLKAVGAGAPVETMRAAGENLIAMWSSQDRHFHNLRHAIDMLARVDELADESHNPDVMRLAAWYHGCVFSSTSEETYRRNGGEDEAASAAFAAQDLRALGVPDRIVERICELILNLKRHNLPPNDIDALALNDADLGTLAVGPQLYKKYRELVRAEYAHVPVQDYLRARLAIIGRLLAREALFSSPLGARWELPARENLEAERRRVECELARLAALTSPEAAVNLEKCLAERAQSPAEEDTGVVADVARATRGSSAGVFHTTSLESCVEELDRLSRSARTTKSVPAPKDAASRQALVQAERDKLAERLHRKKAEARILREARTGEIAAVSVEVAQDEAENL